MQKLHLKISASIGNSRPARLLIVEDDMLIRELEAAVLRSHGYEVITAKDGVEGLERLAEEVFDAVLVDRQMPRLDGATLILALRSAGSRIPVIMVSGSVGFAPLPAAVAREVFAVIPKPARTAEIVSAVASALETGSSKSSAGREHFGGIASLAA